MTWQLQDAKNQFSALVNAAEKDGPQIITVHAIRSTGVSKTNIGYRHEGHEGFIGSAGFRQ